MKKIFVFLFVLVIAAPVYGLRCGNDLAQVGDSKIEVIAACGVPDHEIHVETRMVRLNNDVTVFRDVVQWIYNDLSLYEIHILEFSGDTLVKIDWKRK